LIFQCFLFLLLKQGKFLRLENQWVVNLTPCDRLQLLGILVDNQLIGYCTIEHIDCENRKCEVGIVIGEKDYWHKGIGSAVIRELLQRAFTALHLHRVEAVIHANNMASIRCFARAGFQRDGTLRDAKYRDGRYVDLLVYAILDSEWSI